MSDEGGKKTDCFRVSTGGYQTFVQGERHVGSAHQGRSGFSCGPD
jgi:hypothetical protein